MPADTASSVRRRFSSSDPSQTTIWSGLQSTAISSTHFETWVFWIVVGLPAESKSCAMGDLGGNVYRTSFRLATRGFALFGVPLVVDDAKDRAGNGGSD